MAHKRLCGGTTGGAMRLNCPNCGAQYEVDAGLIPETGRDVQCSNCGHGWFQHPEEPEAEAPLVLDTAPDEAAAAPAAPPRRKLDPAVAGVLREEAEHEAAARRSEAEGALETQQDLGLDGGEDREALVRSGVAARARMARLRGMEDEPPAAGVDGPRHELLPDVEEINSTLRGQEERDAPPPAEVYHEDAAEAPRRSGFRAGFYLILILALIAVAVYALAPQIADAVPQTEPYLANYVDAVNDLRDRANGWISSGIATGRELIGGEVEG